MVSSELWLVSQCSVWAVIGQSVLGLSCDWLQVKTVDNKLLVHAKHEEVGGGKSVYREYNREFLLPTGTNPELIKSSLSKVNNVESLVAS